MKSKRQPSAPDLSAVDVQHAEGRHRKGAVEGFGERGSDLGLGAPPEGVDDERAKKEGKGT